MERNAGTNMGKKGRLEAGSLRGNKRRSAHPKKTKEFRSKETYRKFLAYTHMRTPTGKKAKKPSETISGTTPKHRKEKVVKIAGKRHKVQLTP